MGNDTILYQNGEAIGTRDGHSTPSGGVSARLNVIGQPVSTLAEEPIRRSVVAVNDAFRKCFPVGDTV